MVASRTCEMLSLRAGEVYQIIGLQEVGGTGLDNKTDYCYSHPVGSEPILQRSPHHR